MSAARLPKTIYDPDAPHAPEKLAIIARARELRWNPEAALPGVNNAPEGGYVRALANGVMAMCLFATRREVRFAALAERYAKEAHRASRTA